MRALVIAITQIRDTSNNLIRGCTTMPGCIWTEVSGKRGEAKLRLVHWSGHRIKYWALPDSAKFYYRPQLHCDADDIFNKEHHYFATMAPSP